MHAGRPNCVAGRLKAAYAIGHLVDVKVMQRPLG